jgi:iron(III) transport system substrate-binding protein
VKLPDKRREEIMSKRRFSRRDAVKAATAVAAGLFISPLKAATPEPTAITPELIEAARREGALRYYTSIDLPLAEKIAKSFEAKFPGIAVHVERTGAERVFQRIGQEYASAIYSVDVVNSSDAAHFIAWKRDDLLAAFRPEDVARHYPAEYQDPDGMFASFRVSLSTMGYNTNLVRAEEAPKSFADLLDPKWMGKIVKGHPAYSGTITTATFAIVRELGWEYLEKLAKQKVMQVQSATEPPKKLALGERAVMADGSEYNLFQIKEIGGPVEVIYPTEGAPLIVGPNAVFKRAPHPNAARLFQCFCFTLECQQLIVDFGGLRSMHALVKEKAGRMPLRAIKLMKDDPAGVERTSEEIKARYSRLFGV